MKAALAVIKTDSDDPPANDPRPQTPSSTMTRALDHDNDTCFYPDFAFVVPKPGPADSARIIFGQTVKADTVFVSILLEIKSAPSRSPSGEDSYSSKDNFRLGVDQRIYFAYRDIQKKASGIFTSHPHQLSIIGLAAVGPWWSFTIVVKGIVAHDNIFVTLLVIATSHPGDPASDGRLGPCLEAWKRTLYDEYDVLAPQD
ncbi:hypothetical protein RhiJN_07048 [Ceratobasidium sp. AG-Ba]|nr:hypothetical protein RhiJN_07048 [Ceratobasidium sp. AG-Ba]QRW07932.1 hypothetical protein RhiLY_06931 [Ceratobasidium sp. AG-Ba]